MTLLLVAMAVAMLVVVFPMAVARAVLVMMTVAGAMFVVVMMRVLVLLAVVLVHMLMVVMVAFALAAMLFLAIEVPGALDDSRRAFTIVRPRFALTLVFLLVMRWPGRFGKPMVLLLFLVARFVGLVVLAMTFGQFVLGLHRSLQSGSSL